MTTATNTKHSAQPDVLGGLVPYLTVRDASAAAEFYTRAFGAREVFRIPNDASGRTMHIHLHVNGGSLMLSDPFPEHGNALQTPQSFTVHMKVDDIDARWNRAVTAGAEIVLALQPMFWGERYGQLRDPFGVTWAVNGPIKK